MRFNAFTQSIKIAINRSILQLASIAITAMLGLYSTQVLSELSLALSFAAILFVFVSYIQLGIQAEFSQYYASKNYYGLLKLLRVTFICIFIISLILMIGVWILPDPFLNSDLSIGPNAYNALKILVISLPFVGLLTNISFFLESVEHIGQVTTLRMYQFFLQITLVFFAIYMQKNILDLDVPPVLLIASAYVLSDFLMLVVGMFFLKRILKKKVINIGKSMGSPTSFYAELLKVFKLGLPTMLGMVGQKLIFYFCTSFCASLGVWQTFIFTIINSITFFFQIPLIGIASLLTLKIGYFRGKNDSRLMLETSSQYTKMFITELAAICLIIIVFYGKIVSIFTHDIIIINHMIEMKFFVVIYFLMNAALIFNMGALRGFSDNFVPQAIVLSILVLGLVPCIKVFSTQIDLNQLMILFTTSGLIASTILYIRLKKNFAVLSIKKS